MRAKDQTENLSISTGPLPGSTKIYVPGSMHDIQVAMRRIDLSPTIDENGVKRDNESVVVYDTSGPYTDPNYTTNPHKGLPKLRQSWIEKREDTQRPNSIDRLRFQSADSRRC